MGAVEAALLLGKLVPEIVGWFGGSDAKETAEKVLDVAKEVTGIADPAAAVHAIELDPSLLLQFRTRVKEIEVEVLKAQLADMQSARSRDIELRKITGGANARADRMVLLDVIGLALGVLAMIALGLAKAKYPDAISEGVFGALLAQLSTINSYFGLCLRDAHQFEFGSSRGSRTKDERRVIEGIA